MPPLQINIRAFRENLPKVARDVAHGRSYLVMKHAKPLFRVEPVERPQTAATYTLADLTELRFKGTNTMSRSVDRDAYGV